MNDFIQCFTKDFANFSGRTNRKPYWMFILFYNIIFLVLLGLQIFFISQAIASGSESSVAVSIVSILMALVALVFLIPGISLAIRRIHDLDKSGWFFLIFFIPIANVIFSFYIAFAKGTEGPNTYGDDPLSL